MTNREFSKENVEFNLACCKAGVALKGRPGYVTILASDREPIVKPTKRQASKYRRGYGSAYNFGR